MKVKSIIALLLAAAVLAGTGCNTIEWITYHNSAYGYSIDYPEDWSLNKDADNYLGIFSEEDFAFITLEISGQGYTLEESIEFFIDNIVNHWDDPEIESSSGPVNRWDWIIEYEYTYQGTPIIAKGYFLKTTEFTFVLSYSVGVTTVYRSGEYPEATDEHYLCEQIIDTFELTSH